MALVATEGTKREPAPAGTHLANCFGLIDLGTQTSNIQGKTKVAHKVWVWWELVHEKRDDGKPVTVGTFYSVTLDERGNLRAMLQAWRGKPFTPEELKGFHLRNIVGAPCMLTIVHEPRKGGGVSDKVKGVSGLMKGMKREPLILPAQILDLDADKFDRALFDTLPNFLKEMIGLSPEGRALGLGTGNGQPAGKQYPTQPPDDWDEQGRPIRHKAGERQPGVTTFGDGGSDIPF